MGYFEAISNAYFKVGKDGRRMFYPWGVIGGGYVVDAAGEARLRRAVQIYLIAAIVLAGVGYALGREIGVLVAGVVVIAGYAIAIRSMVQGLEAAGERLGLREAYAAEARGFSKGWLWSMLALMIALFALSVAMFVAEPDLRLQAAGGIAIATALAAFTAWMLVLRGRAGST
jgi:hypothetical protein